MSRDILGFDLSSDVDPSEVASKGNTCLQGLLTEVSVAIASVSHAVS